MIMQLFVDVLSMTLNCCIAVDLLLFGSYSKLTELVQVFARHTDKVTLAYQACFVRDPQSMVSSLRVDVANGKANRLITGFERFERFDSSSTHHTFYEGS